MRVESQLHELAQDQTAESSSAQATRRASNGLCFIGCGAAHRHPEFDSGSRVNGTSCRTWDRAVFARSLIEIVLASVVAFQTAGAA